METSYTELEDMEGTAYQDPKISGSCADPLFWAALCIYIYLHFEYRCFQITKADYVWE